MTPTAKDAPPPVRKEPVNTHAVPVALLLLALLPYATVREEHRLLLAGLSAALGLVMVLLAPGGARSAGLARLGLGLGLAAWALGALGALSLGPEGRAWLQPGVADTLDAALAVVGASAHPLALRPWEALVAWGLAGGLITLGVGVAAAAARPGFTRRLSWGLVGLGLLVLVIAAVHRGQGATSIWFDSGVPSFARDPFFAPFVSPNHAGAWSAALLGVALGLAFASRGRSRAAALVAALLLAIGVGATGSRAAVLDAGAAVATVALVAGGRRLRIATALALVVAAIGGLALGPERIALWVTERVNPELYQAIEAGYSDVVTGRGDIYRDAWSAILQAPMAGYGGAGFGAAYDLARSTVGFTTVSHAHQELLQVAAEHGLPALLLSVLAALALLITGLRRAFRTTAAGPRGLLAGALGGLMALMVDIQVDFPLRIGAIAVLAAILLGICAAREVVEGEGTPAPNGRRGAALIGLVGALALIATARAAQLSADPPARSDWAPVSEALERGDEAIRLALAEEDAAVKADLVASAQAAYEEAVRRQPTRREALQKLGRLRRVRGDAEGALRALEAATRVTPRVPWPWRDLARLRADQHDLAGADEAWKRALALDLPGDGTPYVREALTGGSEDQTLPELAERVLPERADRWLSAARIAEERRDRASADAFYRRAMALKPDVAIELAGALVRWKRPAEAEALLPQIEGGCRKALVAAEIALDGGALEQARDGFSEALKLCGSRERRARLGLARARIGLNDPNGMRALEAMIEEDPSDTAAVRTMVRELEARGSFLEASRYQELLSHPPKAAPADVPVPEQ